MDIYWFSGSPYCWRVMVALALKDVSYTSKRLNGANKEHKTPAFLALNARGTVPVLDDNGVVVCNSMAILAYLEKRYPTPALFGTTAERAARIWERVSDHEERFHPATRRIIRPLFRGKVEQSRADLAEAVAPVEAELTDLEHRLDGREWLVGDAASAAEVVYYPTLQRLVRALEKPDASTLDLPFSALRDRFTNIAAWLDRTSALPGVADTRPPHWD